MFFFFFFWWLLKLYNYNGTFEGTHARGAHLLDHVRNLQFHPSLLYTVMYDGDKDEKEDDDDEDEDEGEDKVGRQKD